MRIGKLRTRAKIQSVSWARNQYGEAIPTWSTFQHCSCNIMPLSAREVDRAKQYGGEVTTKIEIRYFATVTEKNRIIVGERVFDILGVVDESQKQSMLTLYATELKDVTA